MDLCKDCGTPMRALATSWYCPNDCDRKPKASPDMGLWGKVRRKMPRAEALFWDTLASELSRKEPTWLAFKHKGSWFIGKKGSIPRTMIFECSTIIYLDEAQGYVAITKSRDYVSYDEMPDVWDGVS